MASTAVCSSASSPSTRLACRIGPVREQSELDLTADAREMMDFQSLDLLGDRFGPGEQGRHHHQRAQMARAARRAARGPGICVTPNWRVTPWLTSATAESIAGTAPSSAEHAEQDPVHAGLDVEEDREAEQQQGDEGAGAGIAADAERAVGAARDLSRRTDESPRRPRTRDGPRRSDNSPDPCGGARSRPPRPRRRGSRLPVRPGPILGRAARPRCDRSCASRNPFSRNRSPWRARDRPATRVRR